MRTPTVIMSHWLVKFFFKDVTSLVMKLDMRTKGWTQLRNEDTLDLYGSNLTTTAPTLNHIWP